VLLALDARSPAEQAEQFVSRLHMVRTNSGSCAHSDPNFASQIDFRTVRAHDSYRVLSELPGSAVTSTVLFGPAQPSAGSAWVLITGRTAVLFRGSIPIAIAGLLVSIATAQAFDDAKYPDLFGVWRRVNLRPGGQPSFDPTKPWGRGQQAPLTPEYQAIHEASLADQANGGQGNWQSGARCMPPGMPASMTAYGEMEIVVLPEVTHILLNHNSGYHRRIYTDGRDWPKEVEPSFQG